ncbi:hypothetical protein K435DRAFT_662626 [Dendrothele bispora CBS 962.96]|uniref:DUF6589 domain-containing protein n=1 Tax=Dendrothele bispora (strain CBS 962.96) TaxID=1314807 RepID=A0A4S8M618_DENBC|nr:hypothetical protein K435DRAFT_662626 [Dendrothele bispora CBS 962.96]
MPYSKRLLELITSRNDSSEYCSHYSDKLTISFSFFRKLFLHNWLVNISGKANSFKEIDLLQEHQNFWLKVCSDHYPY